MIFGVPVQKINPLEELRCWLILAGGKGRDVLQMLRAYLK